MPTGDFDYRGPKLPSEAEARAQIDAENRAEQIENERELHISRLIRGAVREAVLEHALTQDERQWVRLAIQKEAQSIKFRQAVIEKTTAGLVWALLAGLGFMFLDFLKAHGWKP